MTKNKKIFGLVTGVLAVAAPVVAPPIQDLIAGYPQVMGALGVLGMIIGYIVPSPVNYGKSRE